jgi:NAD(P)-dependent dehydrogenase (short-subunit alcohol dehydrogenase family)
LNHKKLKKEIIVKDYFGYKGKRVVITGAASGMAQAAAKILVDLGAEVYALDVKEVTVTVKKYIKTNLMHKDEIDAAVKQIPDNIYALFNCAGTTAPPFSNVEVTTVNFVGHRHLTERLLPKMNAMAPPSHSSHRKPDSTGGASLLRSNRYLTPVASKKDAPGWMHMKQRSPTAIVSRSYASVPTRR